MIYHLGINTGDAVWSKLSKASGWKRHTLNALCNSSLILHSSCMSMEEDARGNLYHLLFFITSHLYLRSIAQTIKAIEVNITPRMSSLLNTDNFLDLCLFRIFITISDLFLFSTEVSISKEWDNSCSYDFQDLVRR